MFQIINIKTCFSQNPHKNLVLFFWVLRLYSLNFHLDISLWISMTKQDLQDHKHVWVFASHYLYTPFKWIFYIARTFQVLICGFTGWLNSRIFDEALPIFDSLMIFHLEYFITSKLSDALRFRDTWVPSLKKLFM